MIVSKLLTKQRYLLLSSVPPLKSVAPSVHSQSGLPLAWSVQEWPPYALRPQTASVMPAMRGSAGVESAEL